MGRRPLGWGRDGRQPPHTTASLRKIVRGTLAVFGLFTAGLGMVAAPNLLLGGLLAAGFVWLTAGLVRRHLPSDGVTFRRQVCVPGTDVCGRIEVATDG